MSRTVFSDEESGGLGALEFQHPPGTFSPSPATRVTLRALARQESELAGTGLDWGCGVGVLAIGAARLESVDAVVGLDLSESNVQAARHNAELNGVADCTDFLVADSYRPVRPRGRAALEVLQGSTDFLVANPPASATNDGFDFRRRVMREGVALLRPGAVVLVQALSVYGAERVENLQGEEYVYEGLALRTKLVPLDFGRESTRRQMATYVRAEREGAAPYEFFVGGTVRGPVSALEAQAAREAGEPLFGRWQVHRFRRVA